MRSILFCLFVACLAFGNQAQAIEKELLHLSGVMTHTNATSDTSAVIILAANLNRKYFGMFNDSSAVAYCKLGAAPTSTSYWLKMAAGSFYESILPEWQGAINCVWASANGAMRVTEGTL